MSHTHDRIPVSPSLEPALEVTHIHPHVPLIDSRVIMISALSVGVAVVAAFVAKVLIALIAFFTNLSFYGRFSIEPVAPGNSPIFGAWIIAVPVIGGVIVGLMARYGSKAIRGHGIPEAMENILVNESRIPARIVILKPLSAAVSIGTGGPFGAEGPIIATGGALGSLVGQLIPSTATERKVLLAAGAAAGMTATFGTPVSAVLLAVELLLFEWRPRSLIPVALASVTAAAVKVGFGDVRPFFAMPDVSMPGALSMIFYTLLGAVIGVVAIGVTRIVYAVEDAFEERLPVHWMWWPAIGAIAVGVVGYFAPGTLGVGYDNIERALSGNSVGSAMLLFCLLKFVSWAISLGSGTSGGTLAPLMTVGGGLGAILGSLGQKIFPDLLIDVKVAALIGMSALFAGCSRTLLTSVVFAFEATRQPTALLPMLGGCAAAYLISCRAKNSIMTEKIVRRGVHVPVEYAADFLDQVRVAHVASVSVVTIAASEPLEDLKSRMRKDAAKFSHQGYPVIDDQGRLRGVVTRRDLLAEGLPAHVTVGDLLKRDAVTVLPQQSLRSAADRMVEEQIGRLPVVSGEGKLIGIITRSDVLSAHRIRHREHRERGKGLLG